MTNMLKSTFLAAKTCRFMSTSFETKFRNELRAKSGIMRTREFLMKDLYSYSTDETEHDKFYHEAEKAYKRIYDRLSVSALTPSRLLLAAAFSRNTAMNSKPSPRLVKTHNLFPTKINLSS